MNESLKVLPFRLDQPPRRLIERFPGDEVRIESLWRHDREFREICRDYREAAAALRLSEERGVCEERRRCIAELVAELEGEMLAVVERNL